MPANILNLPCYKVRGIQENEHDYHVEVETVESPAACPHCQSANLVGFGRREQMVSDPTPRRAGRPRVGSTHCSVSLTPEEQAFFRALGNGSLTAGLREAYRRLTGASDAPAAPSVSPGR